MSFLYASAGLERSPKARIFDRSRAKRPNVSAISQQARSAQFLAVVEDRKTGEAA